MDGTDSPLDEAKAPVHPGSSSSSPGSDASSCSSTCLDPEGQAALLACFNALRPQCPQEAAAFSPASAASFASSKCFSPERIQALSALINQQHSPPKAVAEMTESEMADEALVLSVISLPDDADASGSAVHTTGNAFQQRQEQQRDGKEIEPLGGTLEQEDYERFGAAGLEEDEEEGQEENEADVCARALDFQGGWQRQEPGAADEEEDEEKNEAGFRARALNFQGGRQRQESGAADTSLDEPHPSACASRATPSICTVESPFTPAAAAPGASSLPSRPLAEFDYSTPRFTAPSLNLEKSTALSACAQSATLAPFKDGRSVAVVRQ